MKNQSNVKVRNVLYKILFLTCAPIGIFGIACTTNSTTVAKVNASGNSHKMAYQEANGTGLTALVIRNDQSIPVVVGLVLNNPYGACSTGHPPIKISDVKACQKIDDAGNPYGGKCKFTIQPGDSVEIPGIEGSCTTGSFAFGGYPQCGTNEGPFATGTTQAEFTLNVPAGLQETTDISLVNGFNGYIVTDLHQGGWQVNTTGDPIQQIGNKGLNGNSGNPGIYPNACDVCEGRNRTPCGDIPPHPSNNSGCQTEQICNVQRSTSGGKITISSVSQPLI